jgi:hypothetical protein
MKRNKKILPGTLLRATMTLGLICPPIGSGEIFMYLGTDLSPMSSKGFQQSSIKGFQQYPIKKLFIHWFLNKDGQRASFTAVEQTFEEILEKNDNCIERIKI